MQDKYLKKQIQRINQKIKVLVNRPNFQEDISKLRKKWKIPSEGIKIEKNNQKWNKELNEATDKYYQEEWPTHRKKLEQLQRSKTYGQYKQKIKELNNLAPLNAFELDINAVLKKYKLSPRWKNPIRRFILFNDSNNLNVSIGVTVTSHLNNFDSAKQQLSINIEEDTILKDIKAIWPTVKEMQSKLHYKQQKKFQPIKNLERDKLAYELRDKGKTYSEIANILSEKFHKDYIYADVNSFIKRHKKRSGIN